MDIHTHSTLKLLFLMHANKKIFTFLHYVSIQIFQHLENADYAPLKSMGQRWLMPVFKKYRMECQLKPILLMLLHMLAVLSTILLICQFLLHRRTLKRYQNTYFRKIQFELENPINQIPSNLIPLYVLIAADALGCVQISKMLMH